MNHMIDETGYSTPCDIEDDPLYDEEEYFDEEAADEERFGIIDEIYI